MLDYSSHACFFYCFAVFFFFFFFFFVIVFLAGGGGGRGLVGLFSSFWRRVVGVCYDTELLE